MASMLPSSVLIGVAGPKLTMAAGVLAWSAAQMLSPAGAGASLPLLLACRFAMGAGEAVTLPSIQVQVVFAVILLVFAANTGVVKGCLLASW